MKKICIITPTFNEVENICDFSKSVQEIIGNFNGGYVLEHVFIDNHSSDGTIDKIREICSKYSNTKAILNSRNFGPVLSPYHALVNVDSDASIIISCDFQEPVELIPELINEWSKGNKVVAGIKVKSDENSAMWLLRDLFYRIMDKLSEIKLNKHFHGFGIYDKEVIECLRKSDISYPYLRGLIPELGFKIKEIPYHQNKRIHGETKNRFYNLVDFALTGIVHHSKIPLRLAVISGAVIGSMSLLISVIYLILKLMFWDSFVLGQAPLLIGIFLVASVQLFFLGVIGEYIGAIFTETVKKPIVVEAQRINFD